MVAFGYRLNSRAALTSLISAFARAPCRWRCQGRFSSPPKNESADPLAKGRRIMSVAHPNATKEANHKEARECFL